MSSVIETTQSTSSDSLPLIQRISYGSLDVAGNLLYCFGSTYILYFYTDVAGISLAVAGIILLLARIVDGIDAPVWGIIIDKTHSRYGKCRPWFLWLPLPFAVFSALSFWSPDISMTGESCLCSNIVHVSQHSVHWVEYTIKRYITADDAVTKGTPGIKLISHDWWANWRTINECDSIAIGRFPW